MNRLLLCSAVAAIWCASAFGQTVVVPNAATSALGGGVAGPSGPVSAEFQTVFAANQFPASNISITGLTFRAAPGTGADVFTLTGTVNLGYAATNPGALSTLFANNIGAAYTLVASPSGATLNAPACAAGSTPCPFGNVLAFTTPFTYIPAAWNLLVDVKATSINISGSTDVVPIGSSAIDNVSLSPLGGTTGSQGRGLVTQFTYTVLSNTPVPPSILLTLAGLAIVGFFVGTRGLKFA